MKKLTKKNISGATVELFEARHSCPCECWCGCTICSPNDETWMFTVLNADNDNYESVGLFDRTWV